MLDKRKIDILAAIIDSYIATAEPIGSRTLSKSYDLGVSSATIRNEMADLEELGYLNKPHTSSGRIPSDKAYRLYVDEIIGSRTAERDESTFSEDVHNAIDSDSYELDDVIANAVKSLSKCTNYTTISLSRKIKPLLIIDVNLIYVDRMKFVLLLVDSDGGVTSISVNLDISFMRDELAAACELLRKLVVGEGAAEAYNKLSTIPNDFGLFDRVRMITQRKLSELTNKLEEVNVSADGITKILYYPEYSDIEKARSFINFLEDKEKLLIATNRHRNSGGITITIGSENAHETLAESSIITASYKLGDNTIGRIGVIGPTRMNYLKLIKTLKYFTEDLEDFIRKHNG